MNIRPYLSFNGDCSEAIELYSNAFDIKEKIVMKFSEMPENPNFKLPKEYNDQICQATLVFGDEYINLSDSGPLNSIAISGSERISLSVESKITTIKNAFNVLSADGIIKIQLSETFFSPCYGVVTDKFGITWNLSAIK